MSLETIWAEIIAHLAEKKGHIEEEILHYPPPIPACDLVFNHLLEERSRLSKELRRAQAVIKAEPIHQITPDTIQQYLSVSPDFDHEQKSAWEAKIAALVRRAVK